MTDLDAGPDARATEPESSVPLGSGVAPANQTAPPCVETDASPPCSGSNRPINGEAPERQSPASDWVKAKPLDVARPDTKGEAAGGRGHFPFSRTDSQEQTCPYVVGKTTLHCSLTPLAEKERAELQAEIGKLRLALARIADENATFSVIGGNIIVDVEPMLTDAEREAIQMAISACKVEEDLNKACGGRQSFAGLWQDHGNALRSLLERTK